MQPRTNQGEGLRLAATWCYIVGALGAIGALVAGVQLIMHKVTACDTDFFCTDSHPYSGAGWAILVGGLVQASVIFVVARVAATVAQHKEALAAPQA